MLLDIVSHDAINMIIQYCYSTHRFHIFHSTSVATSFVVIVSKSEFDFIDGLNLSFYYNFVHYESLWS